MCNLCAIWQYHPCDMYIHLHTICLIGVTESRYGNISFCAKSASISLVDFSVDIATSKKYFRWKFKDELKSLCVEFQFFSALNQYNITILVGISHGNRSLTSYIINLAINWPNICLENINYFVICVMSAQCVWRGGVYFSILLCMFNI